MVELLVWTLTAVSCVASGVAVFFAVQTVRTARRIERRRRG